MKNIVVVGGGSGIFNVLKGLKEYPSAVSAIVTTFDSGGSTGVLRDEFGQLPSGDLRRALIALSPDKGDKTLKQLFAYRFPKHSSLHGHSLGNLLLMAFSDLEKNPGKGIEKAAELLKIRGNAFPVSLEKADVCVRLENGDIIEGETKIDVPLHDGNLSIEEVFLKPGAKMYENAKNALKKADLVVFGPGDLYTSIIPNILTEGFIQALDKSRAKTVFVCNIMTKWGETNDFKASDFGKTLLRYIKRTAFDFVVVNTGKVEKKMLEKYKRAKAEQVVIDETELKRISGRIIKNDLVYNDDEVVRHDAKKIAAILHSLV